MKILHITDAAAGGVLTSVTALVRSQAHDSRFSEVSLCYTPRPDSPPHEEIVAGVSSAVRVQRWAPSPRLALVPLLAGVMRELRHQDWDVIHLHSSRAGFAARMSAILLRSRAHLVYSPHGFSFNQAYFSRFLARTFLALERLALRGGRDLVLVSDTEAQVAAEKLPQARTAVLANAIDTSAFSPAGQPSGQGQERFERPLEVVHLGRIAKQKRPDHFARIAADVHRELPGRFSFTWIGDGDRSLLDVRDSGAHALEGTGASVSVTGWVSPTAIRGHLSRASIVLFTSSMEGMPMAVLEAGSMAIPTVGSDVVGVRDLIDDGVDGILFRTTAEAVTALGGLLHDDRRARIGTAARARVVRDHSQTDLAERSLQIYRDFIASAPAERQARKNLNPRSTRKQSTVNTAVAHTGRRSA